MPRLLLATLCLLAATSALAQTPGTCEHGTATATLDANDVEATLFNTGTLFYGPGAEAAYTVPKFSGKNAAYAGSLWVGGRVGSEVRVAGTSFGQGGSTNDHFEFWPGPLNDGGTLPNPADCSAYDRIWVVSARDVARYEASGEPTPDLAEWPVGLGAAAVDASGAPIVPTSRGQTVDLSAGERPVVYGSQTAFWVMNDVGNTHETTGSAPLGVEVQVTAFAIASAEAALDQATFYHYRVVNRTDRPIDDVRLTWWTDTDLGQVNEYQGVDTTRALAFTYNPPTDTVYDIPPATGVDFLDQPLGAYLYLVNGDPRRNDPRDAVQFDRVQRGLWPDGTPVTTYGIGYNAPGSVPTTVDLDTTRFAFPGDPVTRSFWSELNADGEDNANFAGNKRSVPTTRPADLGPGEATVLTVAFLFAQGGDHLDSVRKLRESSDRVQGLFDGDLLLQAAEIPPLPTARAALQSPDDGHEVLSERVTFEWSAVPGATAYLVEVSATPDFEEPQTFRVRGTRLATGDLTASQVSPFYWRVVPVNPGGEGPPSETRSFTYYQYASGPLLLDRQTPAFVEVQGPGGLDPCGEMAVSTFGCAEVGGNAVVGSPNATGQYTLSGYGRFSSVVNVSVLGEREVEIRWTGRADGSYALINGLLGRVPFQVWDIGATPPGGLNDPADDVRLIPVIDGSLSPDECHFGFVQTEGALQTPSINAVYPTDDVALSALERSTVPLRPDGCNGGLSYERLRELARSEVAIVGASFVAVANDLGTSDLTGSVVRLYTADEALVRLDPDAPPGSAALDAPYPNPVTGRLTVGFTVDRPGRVRLVVVDMLGREVVRLVDGENQSAGWRRVTVDTEGWAPGVYAVFLRTEGGETAQTVTVVR